MKNENVGVGHEPLRLGAFIRQRRERILGDWEAEVRQLPYARGLSRPRLLDHLPDLLERIANVVDSVHTGGASSLDEMPEVHALERLDSGYDLDDVAEEYALLRGCILQRYGDYMGSVGAGSMALAMREMVSFNRTFDEAVAAAVSRYARARERTLVALDRISEAAFGKEETDAFLPRLLRVMLETTEAVDSVSLLLREGDVLRVNASVGLEEEVTAGLSIPVGEGFFGRIAAERRPLELRSAATDPLIQSEVIRARGTRALYGVPLMHGEEVLGVAHMGSRTAFEFSNEDKLLFRAMVSRATGLILQAWLTAREHAARAEAEERKQLLDLIVEQSSDAIIMADAQGAIQVFNAEAARLHGLGGGEPGRPGYELLTMEETPLSPGQWPLFQALQGGAVAEGRWKVRRQDGSLRTLNGTAAPLRRSDGTTAGAVLNARDDTERLRREREQAETLALLDALLATSTAGMAFVDPGLRYVRVNAQLASITGKSPDALLGQRVDEMPPRAPPVSRPCCGGCWRRASPCAATSSAPCPRTRGRPTGWATTSRCVRGTAGCWGWAASWWTSPSASSRRSACARRRSSASASSASSPMTCAIPSTPSCCRPTRCSGRWTCPSATRR